MPDDTCRRCGRPIRMQIRKNTGFCTETCEELHRAQAR